MKGPLAITLAILGALLALGVSYYAFFVQREHRTETAAPLEPETLLLATASGTVEVANPDGAWRPAPPGYKLTARERIRTGDDGTAELRAADGSMVKLLGGTEARVDELRRELKRLHLGAGMVEADVRDDPNRVFEVAFDEGAARTRGAAFTASSNGDGTAAVAARRGEVILSARGKEVVIRSGQFSRVLPGAPPETPQPVPASLFLRVEWPPPTSTRSRLAVSGQTVPGARVKIGGKWVHVDARGHYRAEFDEPDGVHELHVRATDVGGHLVDEKSPRIIVDTKTDFKIHPLKWK